MLDNKVLKEKIKRELESLKLSDSQKDVIVKELNYLSDLLIDVYLLKSKNEQDHLVSAS